MREIKGSLKDDRRHRTKAVGEKIVGLLDAGELAEAWGTLKGWYTAASERAPKPCYASLAKQTAEREELYGKVDPPGEPIPINVDPKEVPDACPEDAEIRAAVRSLRTGRTGNTRGLRAENTKAWLRGSSERRRRRRQRQQLRRVPMPTQGRKTETHGACL